MAGFWESLSSWIWVLIPLAGMAMIVAKDWIRTRCTERKFNGHS
jgi:hypothetical protein